MRVLSLCTLFLGLIVLAGCGKAGPAKGKVTGSITVDNQPVTDGDVVFESLSGGGVPESIKIVGGAYEGFVTAGKHKVKIFGYKNMDVMPGNTPGADAGGNRTNIVPAKYNQESTEVREVTTAGPNKFDFSLSSK
jgi:hypothetical protein